MTKRETADWLSISDVTRLFNDILEASFPGLKFQGEISQIQRAPSGHVYFTVKDPQSQLSCVMWAGTVRSLRFRPEPGMLVRCQGKPNVYGANGRLQVIVHSMEPAGEGELQKRFLELKARLEKEGFFSAERKRPLPYFPKAIGIVTSKTGAVIHDMMVKLRERMPSMTAYLVDTRVQGEGAAGEIAKAIDYLNSVNLVDVIIVARGGGSLEDLWAFNEEEVVKAVFRSRVPVISGVGHEVDVTLCDLVADVRAPTPTAAAEMVVPRRSDLIALLDDYYRRLTDSDRWFQPRVQRLDDLSLRLDTIMVRVFEEGRLRLGAAQARLKTIQPDRVIALLDSRVSVLQERLTNVSKSRIANFRERVNVLEGRLAGHSPIRYVKEGGREVQRLQQRLQLANETLLSKLRIRVDHLAQRFESNNPARVLDRGFAIVEKNGKPITTAKSLIAGENVAVRFADGSRQVTVKN